LKETPVLELAIRETIETARAHGLEKLAPETATTAVERPAPARKGPTPLFSAFAGSYLDLRCQGYTLRRDDESPHAATGAAFERTSLRNWQSSVRVFTEIVGDLALGAYTKDEVIEFNTMIQRLPANFGKSSRDMRTARQVIEDLDETEEQALNDLITDLRAKGRPSAEIEDAVAKAKTKRIAATTVKRHQTALQSIFDHAFNQRLIDSNPLKGRILTDAEVRRWQKSAARVERIGWGDAIYALLGSEIFRDPLSDIGEPLFWAPLIAMYGGLRLEEICQLRIRDFGTDDGVPFVAVQNELGSQSLKTNNSLRRVPLHQALIDLGLPQLVELRREQGMSRLFPDMNRSKSKGTLSAIMSKRFGYYIRSRGIKDEGLDFHALRTEFLVRLTRARVPDHVRKGLMGHDQTDVTHKNYFRAGERMSSLKDYIDRNDIDHSGVLSPFGRSIPLAQAKLRVVK
jgi:integrase